MQPLHSIALGHVHEQQIANMEKILQRGFKETVCAVCWSCNRVESFTLAEAAKHITESSWPTCCSGKKMSMEDVEAVPPF